MDNNDKSSYFQISLLPRSLTEQWLLAGTPDELGDVLAECAGLLALLKPSSSSIVKSDSQKLIRQIVLSLSSKQFYCTNVITQALALLNVLVKTNTDSFQNELSALFPLMMRLVDDDRIVLRQGSYLLLSSLTSYFPFISIHPFFSAALENKIVSYPLNTLRLTFLMFLLLLHSQIFPQRTVTALPMRSASFSTSSPLLVKRIVISLAEYVTLTKMTHKKRTSSFNTMVEASLDSKSSNASLCHETVVNLLAVSACLLYSQGSSTGEMLSFSTPPNVVGEEVNALFDLMGIQTTGAVTNDIISRVCSFTFPDLVKDTFIGPHISPLLCEFQERAESLLEDELDDLAIENIVANTILPSPKTKKVAAASTAVMLPQRALPSESASASRSSNNDYDHGNDSSEMDRLIATSKKAAVLNSQNQLPIETIGSSSFEQVGGSSHADPNPPSSPPVALMRLVSDIKISDMTDNHNPVGKVENLAKANAVTDHKARKSMAHDSVKHIIFNEDDFDPACSSDLSYAPSWTGKFASELELMASGGSDTSVDTSIDGALTPIGEDRDAGGTDVPATAPANFDRSKLRTLKSVRSARSAGTDKIPSRNTSFSFDLVPDAVQDSYMDTNVASSVDTGRLRMNDIPVMQMAGKSGRFDSMFCGDSDEQVTSTPSKLTPKISTSQTPFEVGKYNSNTGERTQSIEASDSSKLNGSGRFNSSKILKKSVVCADKGGLDCYDADSDPFLVKNSNASPVVHSPRAMSPMVSRKQKANRYSSPVTHRSNAGPSSAALSGHDGKNPMATPVEDDGGPRTYSKTDMSGSRRILGRSNNSYSYDTDGGVGGSAAAASSPSVRGVTGRLRPHAIDTHTENEKSSTSATTGLITPIKAGARARSSEMQLNDKEVDSSTVLESPVQEKSDYLTREELVPSRTAKADLSKAIAELETAGWPQIMTIINSVRTLVVHHSKLISSSVANLKALTKGILKNVASLRSIVAKNATLALGDMFCFLGKHMDGEVSLCSTSLVKRICDSSAFVSESCESAICEMIEHCSVSRSLSGVLANCDNRNPNIRAKVTIVLLILVDTKSEELKLLKDFSASISPKVGKLIVDHTPVARAGGREIVKIILSKRLIAAGDLEVAISSANFDKCVQYSSMLTPNACEGASVSAIEMLLRGSTGGSTPTMSSASPVGSFKKSKVFFSEQDEASDRHAQRCLPVHPQNRSNHDINGIADHHNTSGLRLETNGIVTRNRSNTSAGTGIPQASPKSKAPKLSMKKIIDSIPELDTLPEVHAKVELSKNWMERIDGLTALSDIIVNHGQALIDIGKLDMSMDKVYERISDGSIKVIAHALLCLERMLQESPDVLHKLQRTFIPAVLVGTASAMTQTSTKATHLLNHYISTLPSTNLSALLRQLCAIMLHDSKDRIKVNSVRIMKDNLTRLYQYDPSGVQKHCFPNVMQSLCSVSAKGDMRIALVNLLKAMQASCIPHSSLLKWTDNPRYHEQLQNINFSS